MPAIQVRDLPQELYDQLVETARRDHRSIAQETTFIIEEYCSKDYSHSTGRPPAPYNLVGPQAAQSRQARRELVQMRIAQLPGFQVPREFPGTEALLAEERETR